MTYSEILHELDKAVANQWIQEEAIANLLANSELAGNQHVMFFELPGGSDSERKSFFDSISNPSGPSNSSRNVGQFLTVPSTSSFEMMAKDAERVVVKLVYQREYWIKEELKSDDPDCRLQRLTKHRERVPLILKASISKNLVQIRVPRKEKGLPGTAKNNYLCAEDILSKHYDTGNVSGWFRKMKAIPIGDAFNKIINEQGTLSSMWSDSPENRNITSSIRNKGRPKLDRDLRDEDDWDHATGYARKEISGFFNTDTIKPIYAMLFDDRIQVRKGTFRNVARLFVPHFCVDGDLENVIDKIRKHI